MLQPVKYRWTIMRLIEISAIFRFFFLGTGSRNSTTELAGSFRFIFQIAPKIRLETNTTSGIRTSITLTLRHRTFLNKHKYTGNVILFSEVFGSVWRRMCCLIFGATFSFLLQFWMLPNHIYSRCGCNPLLHFTKTRREDKHSKMKHLKNSKSV